MRAATDTATDALLSRIGRIYGNTPAATPTAEQLAEEMRQHGITPF